MKKLLAMLLCTLMLSLCACQKTPDEEYVVNKGDNKADEIINQTAIPIPNTEPPNSDEPEPTHAEMTSEWQDASVQPVFPERWEDVIDNEFKQILIDADVITGDMSAYPVHLTARHSLTADDIRRVGKVLFPDAAGWCSGREVLKETIRDAMADIIDNDELTEETREIQLELLQTELNGSSAVDELRYEQVSGFDNVPVGASSYYGLKLNDGTGSVFSTEGSVFLSRCKDGTSDFYNELDPDSVPIEPEFELDEAILRTEAFLNDCGLNGFELSASKPERMFNRYSLRDLSSGWNLKFVRSFGYYPFDSNAMDIGDDSLFDFGDDFVFAAQWEMERIELYVAKEGVITFSWSDPVDDVGIVNENVQLMDFDTLSATAKRLLTAAVNSPYWDEGYFKLEECILTVVPSIKKDSDLAYMMPVWVCRFGAYYSVNGPMMAHFYTPGEQIKNGQDFTIAFNAIDGTRVALP